MLFTPDNEEMLKTTFDVVQTSPSCNIVPRGVQKKWNMLQRAKKVVSDSPGLVDFVIGVVNSVFNLPDGQVMFF